MKMFIVFAAIVAVAVAAPAFQADQPEVRSETLHNNIGVDGYNYAYELSNGQAVEETAELRTVPGAETPVVVVRGSFSYVDPQTNQRYTVTYVADENGFHPAGDHLPV